jgi:hypothetical protein
MIEASAQAASRRYRPAISVGIILGLLGTLTPGTASAGPWQPVGTMIEGRYDPTATLLTDGTVLVTGGNGNKANKYPFSPLASAERFDPKTNAFTAQSPMTSIRIDPGIVGLADGRVLFLGGGSFRGSQVLDSLEVFDPATGTFTLAPGKLASPRMAATATLLPDRRILVAGGAERNGRGRAVGTAELFDPVAGSSQATGSLAGPRYGHFAVTLPDGRVVILGGAGKDEKPIRRVEVYDPASGIFTPHGELALAEGESVATVTPLSDGKLLVTGALHEPRSDPAKPNGIEIYDPATGQSRRIGVLRIPRLGHRALLLANGRVLIVGGARYWGGSAEWLSSTALIDPSTGTVSSAGSMALPRQEPALVRLPDGRPLVLGGDTGFIEADSLNLKAEVYTP